LADRNSVDSFYRGDIAQTIADEFKKNGGIVTAKDLADYRAHELEPLQMKWKDTVVYTAPLTAGGLSILQMLTILREMNWAKLPTGFEKTHGYLEALRLCWRDRLEHLGDPGHVEVPIKHLLAAGYANDLGRQVQKAVKENKALPIQISAAPDDGTMNLSAVDCHGNMVAMTLTQGGSFGSKVTVEGLGLVLGHGMWRFEPKPGHPNSVAPGKRPLHNMCPSVVLRKGKPVMAVGGAGGRMIPNSILKVLTDFVALEKTMEQSMAAPRLHNEGNMNVSVEREWPASELEEMKKLGYKTSTGNQAIVSAVSFTPITGECNGVTR
jgi:gamma-glutamyltranspeptidase / glutathione hydrolase